VFAAKQDPKHQHTPIECMVQVQDQVDLPVLGPVAATNEATEDCTCSEPSTAGLTDVQPALKAKSGIEMTGACGTSMIAAMWSSSSFTESNLKISVAEWKMSNCKLFSSFCADEGTVRNHRRGRRRVSFTPRHVPSTVAETATSS